MASTWNERNSFVEAKLKEMAHVGEIQALTVRETMDGYVVIATGYVNVLNEGSGKFERKWVPVAWRTRRDYEPRIFARLENLMDRLSEVFPTIPTVKLELLTPEERRSKQLAKEELIPVESDGTKAAGRPKHPKNRESMPKTAQIEPAAKKRARSKS